MQTDHLPQITADEVEKRADNYVEASVENAQPEVLKKQGITVDQLKFAFRRNFYSFISSHFVVVPPENHDSDV